MIAYGACVGDPDRAERFLRPGIAGAAERDSPILAYDEPDSIYGAYNEILDAAAQLAGLEALVLLHDDTELLDDRLPRALRAAFADPTVGLAGVRGARHIAGLRWWEGEEMQGAVRHGALRVDHGRDGGDVHCLDGCLLALSREVVGRVRFDPRLDGFRGEELELAWQVRVLGLRIVLIDADVAHHAPRAADGPEFEAADLRFRSRWSSLPDA